MKPMLSFSTMGVCLIFFFLTVPIAGAQEEVVANNLELSQEDKIAAEKEMLEAKIAELEEKPLDYFGSQKNKRTRIGFYRYRLETLLQDPDKYFSEPEKYEGNIKTPE
jgi:hypothetical protein